MEKKYPPKISANHKYIHFEGIFPPANLSGMIIGEHKIMRFYLDDNQYYEGEVMKIAEENGTEDFRIISELILKKENNDNGQKKTSCKDSKS